MPLSPRRRRIARYVLVGLLLVHALAFLFYGHYSSQLDHGRLAQDARDQWRSGHLDLAADEYRRFVENYPRIAWPLVVTRTLPSEASGWFALGRIETERHHLDAALADFARAMALEPSLGRREYRDLLFESGRFAELEAFARATLAANPHSLPGIFDLGAALYAKGNAAAAALAYERGLSYVAEFLRTEDPGFPGGVSVQESELLNLASIAHLAAGDPERATAVCDGLSTRLSPRSHLDRLCRGFLEAHAGRLNESRKLLGTYVPARPEEEALVTALLGPAAP